ncbi:MAG: cobalamin biosynthesis protein CobD [Rhizobiales bacterium 32-66-8]|nr:MAG: cobalamin biosynthesis protein CobD [Rhizobiales bacterium 32-66-8]
MTEAWPGLRARGVRVPLPLLPLFALLVEAAFGYPRAVLDRIGHPVIWMGRLIAGLDRRLNQSRFSPRLRRGLGVVALLVLIIATALPASLLQAGLLLLPFGVVLVAVAASSLLAQRSLYTHVAAVADALERDGLEAGRTAVSHIVGRDPAHLDESGVARAAIESLAENFSDGVVAPAVWLAVGGLPGAVTYKAINTADSMIGHRTARHEAYGWASARLDDLVNLPASRLAGFLLVAASAVMPVASAGAAWRTLRRDARHHRSPNAGWPEAAMAGGLGIRIAGPRVYDGVSVEAAYMGDGRAELDASDIRRALRLYCIADGIGVALAAAGALWFILA